jgi:hypothetical protein
VLLSDCLAPESDFRGLTELAAKEHDVEPRALAVRTLLHLPRLARSDGSVAVRPVEAELRRQAGRLLGDVRAVQPAAPLAFAPLSALNFGPVAPGQAQLVFSRLHYLRSWRPGSLNFGLLHPATGFPVALCSLSRYDWHMATCEIQAFAGMSKEQEIWDVSRVYCCDEAPQNVISFLLARVRDELRRSRPSVALLATRVDPNLGFTGASYRAANWQIAARMPRRPYLYLDGWYVSPRQLRDAFGTSNVTELRRMLPDGTLSRSRVPLRDSMIFCCRVSAERRRPTLLPAGSPRSASGSETDRRASGPASSSAKDSQPSLWPLRPSTKALPAH